MGSFDMGNSFLSKIHNIFAQPMPQQNMQKPDDTMLLPKPNLAMPGPRQDPQGAGGNNMLEQLLAGDKDKSGLLAKIAMIFGGGA